MHTVANVGRVDGGAAGRPRERPSAVRMAIVAIATIAVLGGIAAQVVGGPAASLDGRQRATPAMRVTSAEYRAWRLLVPLDGSTRVGWPRPMIAAGDEICFGFENDAFRPPARPSLARCVDGGVDDSLARDDVVELLSVRSGRDVWHVLATGASVTGVEAVTSAGEPVGDDRIHVDDHVIVVRLAVADPLVAMSWRHGATTVRCTPPGDPNTDGRFCPDA